MTKFMVSQTVHVDADIEDECRVCGTATIVDIFDDKIQVQFTDDVQPSSWRGYTVTVDTSEVSA